VVREGRSARKSRNGCGLKARPDTAPRNGSAHCQESQMSQCGRSTKVRTVMQESLEGTQRERGEKKKKKSRMTPGVHG